MRTLVDLPDKQIKELNLMSKQRMVSRASLVREAVDAYLASHSKAARDAALDDVFGIWKDRNIDTMQYLDELRAEWER